MHRLAAVANMAAMKGVGIEAHPNERRMTVPNKKTSKKDPKVAEVVATPTPTVADKDTAVANRSEFASNIVLLMGAGDHGCRPGSRRAAIMDAVLAMVQDKKSVGDILGTIRPMKGGPEDLRILVSRGVLKAPDGVQPKATRAMVVKLKDAQPAPTAEVTEAAPARRRKSA